MHDYLTLLEQIIYFGGVGFPAVVLKAIAYFVDWFKERNPTAIVLMLLMFIC
ncbi:hypothetical protein A0J48_012190 [Sphaerospermopsis aphanizomenoides BCCUSP55]|uniref:hypothetical protein n=1 Tax=Sphaerospermopsis aphanizomenoides TaxID=459663 RepID=UPI0019049A18|nr:hypothetical protein [Sphaerospermopsis aphanizomenoides]MBK1988288.1 hypothetical protein [Sphaerospermopsis aphanizomenoides BCCUSP55]